MEALIEIEGTIVKVLPKTLFRVRLDNQQELLAHISGKLRKNFIKIGIGDRVLMEMSPYDLTKARICYRLRTTLANSNPPKRSFGPKHHSSAPMQHNNPHPGNASRAG